VGGGDSTKSPLTDGHLTGSSQSAVSFLTDLAGWFQKDPDRPIAYRILQKAEELVTPGTAIMDLHFLYQVKIETTYRDSHIPKGRERVLQACRQLIAIVPQAAAEFRKQYLGPLVEHRGFQRLAALHEYGKEYTQAIAVCKEALSQGWLATGINASSDARSSLIKTWRKRNSFNPIYLPVPTARQTD